MASPFPGMDPFLEGEMWQEFHETLANQIRQQLIPFVRPKYVALLAKRYALDQPIFGILKPDDQKAMYPDVHVVRPSKYPVATPTLTSSQTSTLTATPYTTEWISPINEEVPILSIEIRDVAERRLVTLIEILSPANKHGEGAMEYSKRRQQILRTYTHLLEIDLLVKGKRVLEVEKPPPNPYFVYLSRFDQRPVTQVWEITLQQPLPTIPVPLLPPDPDVLVDLQAVITACFDLVGYETLLDYHGPPPSGFNKEDRQWIEDHLREEGLRY
jgi:hypothetical protein